MNKEQWQYDTWCANAWGHIALEPDGNVKPCCYSSDTMGNIKENSFKNIYNNDFYKKLRLEFLSNNKPSGCFKCWRQEELGVRSLRQISNNRHWAKNVRYNLKRNTNEDGTIDNVVLHDSDLRFSNKCNMACIMCSPRFSSKWATELKQEQKFFNLFEGKAGNKEFIDQNFDSIKGIYFAGGEPLIMDEHWYILEKLKDYNKENKIDLRYSTNLSTLTYKNYDIRDYWKNWNGIVEAGLSIDDIDERFDYIRYGKDWTTVEQNIKDILTLDNIIVWVSIATGFYNILYLKEIMTKLTNIGIPSKSISLNPVMGELSVHQAPKKLKQDALSLLKELRNIPTLMPAKMSVIEQLCKQDPDLHDFTKKLKQIDFRRSTDHLKTFPRLQKYI